MRRVIVINGPGTSGKNTFIRAIRRMLSQAEIPVYSFSSIFPIKDYLFKEGLWDGETKDESARNLMIRTKAEMVADGDKPLLYLLDKIKSKEVGLFFIHIRERSEIEKFIDECDSAFGIKPKTIHYDRQGREVINTTAEIGTREFEGYDYDFLVGDGLGEVKKAAVQFIHIIGIENFRTNLEDSELLEGELHSGFDDELSAGYA